MQIIPAIDLLGGRCVRLYQGDFDKVTEYARDPVELALSYRDAGSRLLHLVDLDGARAGQPANLPILRRLAGESGMAVQIGGGIRTRAMAETLLEAGAERIVIGSMAVKDSGTVLDWMRAAGPERFVLAFDVRLDPATGNPVALTHGWRESSGNLLWSLMDEFLSSGARHFLCTDVSRDGTLAGPNNELYAECVRRYPEAAMIASGGLGSAADLPGLAATGVAGVVTGKALLDGRLTLEEIRKFSRAG